jgi:hypothetical protein
MLCHALFIVKMIVIIECHCAKCCYAGCPGCEVTESDEHSSLLRDEVNYDRKFFYSLNPWP